jgi:AcrR family transcriptional regulator
MPAPTRPRSASRQAPGRPTTHDRAAWIAAATDALREGGVAAVQIEPIARRLGATKGGFYWHFTDRAELLEALMARWMEETRWLIRSAREASTPRERLHRYFDLVSTHREYPSDAEILAWARRDPAVARRVNRTERARLTFIRAELESGGLEPREANRRARIAYFATQGWVERASRGQERHAELPEFTRHLFDLMLNPSSA